MYLCNCGREFEKQSSLNSHARFCKLYIKVKKPSKYKIKENLYKCECEKEFDNYQKLNSHFCYCLIHRKGIPPKNPNRADYFNGKRGWKKGLTKETDSRIAKISQNLKSKYESGELISNWKNKILSNEHKEKLSIKQSGLNYSGGICKWYNYIKPNGTYQKVQGTWELKFAKYLDTIDEKWIKIGNGKEIHTFIWVDKQGNKRRYTPDFWCPILQKYFEVKGYWRESDRNKMKLVLEQNDINIEIIEENQMKLLKLL